MSGKPAARITDKIACFMPQVLPIPVPHACPPGTPIVAVGAPTVLIGGLPAARVTDFSTCITPIPLPNPIYSGAFPVSIQGLPAARMTDPGTHALSQIMPPCCPTVIIGLAGITGNVEVGKAMCQAAAAGRTSGSTQQSYQNCGVESSRQVINQANNSAVTEDSLLDTAMQSGHAVRGLSEKGKFDRANSGSTSQDSTQAILSDNGVSSTIQDSTKRNLGMAMTRGSGVIAEVDAGVLWNDPTYVGGGHAIIVLGAVYDDAGDLTYIYINDTGTGRCAQKVPAEQFLNAVEEHPSGSARAVVTSDPIF